MYSFFKKILFSTFSLLLPVVAEASTYHIEIDGVFYWLYDNSATVTCYELETDYGEVSYCISGYYGYVNIPETISHGDQIYTVDDIGMYTFYNSSITGVSLPSSIRFIGSHAFYNCYGLTEIVFPNSVTSIDSQAFFNCSSLTNIKIPFSVTYISNQTFSGCNGLNTITVESANTNYDSRDDCNAIIKTASNKLIAGCKNSIIPNTVTSIGNSAFYKCNGLTDIEIPNSVTLIEDYAFSECIGLTSITIPNSVTTIGSRAFYGCSNLQNIEIPNSVMTIGYNALDNCNKLIISGKGEWQGNSIGCITSDLYIDSRITSIKGIKINSKSNVYSYAPIPPTCDENSFTNYSATLHVPASSLASYFTADYWCNFANIIGDAIEPNISISQDSVEVKLGTQFSLEASIIPTNATPNDIIWKSTNKKVATVSNGIVTAMGVGECDIIAECLYQRAICHVVVNDTHVTITLDQQEAMLLPNHMLILTPSAPTIMPEEFIVSSSNPSVAAVRLANGKIQIVGIKEGTTTITVASTDGNAIPATCLVTVYTESGDLNSDGFVNISDVTSLIDYILGGDEASVTMKNADVNGDGRINISDVTSLIDTLLSKTE